MEGVAGAEEERPFGAYTSWYGEEGVKGNISKVEHAEPEPEREELAETGGARVPL